jgi:hypothetical protein
VKKERERERVKREIVQIERERVKKEKGGDERKYRI